MFVALGALMMLFAAGQAPRVGDPVPPFEGPATDGTLVHSADLKGRWTVLYFYPKAFTPGCTAEACALRDGFSSLQEAGVVIYGISLDPMEKLKKFKAEYRLPFELISDGDKTIARAFHTLALLGLYTERKTFIIDPEGRIAKIFETVDTKKHDREVLEAVTRLKAAAPRTGAD
jgi:thioredoxin-dependent peroxiredoxin